MAQKIIQAQTLQQTQTLSPQQILAVRLPKELLNTDENLHQKRMATLYQKDQETNLKVSYKNPEIITLYQEFYGKPLSELA